MRPGFAARVGEGRLTLQELGRPAATSRRLSRAQSGGVGVLLLGRLTYVDEPRPSDGDAAIVLARYRAQGSAALEALEGEFSILVWDLPRRRLYALRDPLGTEPCYWTRITRGVALSTSVAALLHVQPSPALDPGYLANILARPVLAVQETRSEATCHAGIHRLLPGSILSIDLDDLRDTRSAAVDWRARLTDPGTERGEAIAEQVAATLDAAVATRLDGPMAAHFSGGMDSTAIALLARRHLARKGPECLTTLSFVYERLASLKFEGDYVRRALAGVAGLSPHLIAADDLLSFDGYGVAERLDEPYAALLMLAQDRALFAPAVSAGVTGVLTGEGGDDVLDIAPYHIAGMLRRGRLGAAWGEARRWAAAHNVDPWSMLTSYGLTPLRPLALRAGLRGLLAGGRVGWREQGEGTIAPWIMPDFARTHDMRGRSLAHLTWLWRGDRDAGMSAALAAIQCRTGEVRRQVLASPHDIHLSHPFLDARMLRLGLGLRMRYRQDPARQKPLLADAMRDVLPEEIRSRRAKGNFNEVYFKGLARNRPAIETVIRAAPIDGLGMIDKDALIDAVRKMALGAEVSGRGMMQLNLTLSVVHWLAGEPALRRTQDVVARETRHAIDAAAAPVSGGTQ